jgi:hypothetical protein
MRETDRRTGGEELVQAGQKVRFKPNSPLGSQLKIPRDAQGAVLCRYRLLRGKSSAHRLDVRFSPELVVWGVPDDQFETVEEGKSAN